jgi:hypothetical protein
MPGTEADAETRITGSQRSFTPEEILWVARQFSLDVAKVEPFDGCGNINLHTFLITDQAGRQHLLQRINTDVFRQPFRVMASMVDWIDAQHAALAGTHAESGWEPITLVPTQQGDLWLDLSDQSGYSVWRMMVLIEEAVSYKSLADVGDRQRSLEIAEELGRGLALTADLAAGVSTAHLASSLPGYRDTAGYFAQFDSVVNGHRSLDQVTDLPQNEEVFDSTAHLYLLALTPDQANERLQDPDLQPFVKLAKDKAIYARTLQARANESTIRKVAIHGDTKIENFLFCRRTGRVRSLVDLDTIMPYTWLADWGDMLRSLVNVAGEKETDLDRVQVDREVYEAVAKGFLGTTKDALPEEIELMHDAIKIITLELGVRFLTDYLRGDNYFMLAPGDPSDLNKTRAMVQLTLFRRLEETDAWASDLVARLQS